MILPSVVRLAAPADEPELAVLIRSAAEEGMMFKVSEQKVLGICKRIINARKNPNAVPQILGVIGTSTDLQAMTALVASQPDYSDEWFLGEAWTFVRPDCRRSHHAQELLAFSKRAAAMLGLKCISGIASNVRTEPKVRLYRRRFGTAIGAFFMFDPNGQAA